MGKGKRIRKQKANQRVTMGRGEFKAYMFNVIDHCDDASFTGLCDIFLTACGVIDQDGNITEEYADSPYWVGGNDGTPLRPSEHANLLQQLSPSVRNLVMSEEMNK